MSDFSLSLRLPVGAQQLYRQRTSTMLVVLGVTVSVVMLFVQLGLQKAVFGSGVRVDKAIAGQIAIVNRNFQSIQSFSTVARDMIEVAEAYPGVEKAMPFYYGNMPVINVKDGSAQQIMVYGIDPAYPALRLPGLTRQLQTIAMARRYLYDSYSRPNYGDILRRIGQPGGLRIKGPLNTQQLHKVISIAGTFRLGPNVLYNGALLTSAANFGIAPGWPLDRVSMVVVKLKPGVDAGRARKAIAALVGNRAKVLTKSQLVAAEKHFWADDTPIGYITDLGLVVGVAIGIIFIYQAIFQVISTNIPEYAVLKSLGYSNKFFAYVIIQISAIIVAASYVIGIILSFIIFYFAESATHLGIDMTFNIIVSVLAITVTMALASAFLALRRLVAVDPITLFS